MAFKSKEEIRKWSELLKAGKITKDQFHENLSSTEDVHSLPERINVQHPKIPKIREVGTTKVIK